MHLADVDPGVPAPPSAMPSQAVQVTLGVAAAALFGTIYVLVHERRRRAKGRRRQESGADGGSSEPPCLTREHLIEILEESSSAAFQLIEQTRKMVFAKHEATGKSLESVVEELQKDFEVSSESGPASECPGPWMSHGPRAHCAQVAMQTVVGAIRNNHGVTEAQVTQAMLANQTDMEVRSPRPRRPRCRPRPLYSPDRAPRA